MAKYTRTPYDSSLDNVFLALADPTRRAILSRLVSGALPVTLVAQPFKLSLAGVSKHLTILEQAGLVRRRKQGRYRMCELNKEPLMNGGSWIDLFLKSL